MAEGLHLNCGKMRVSWYISHYEFVLGAGAKAKTVTTVPVEAFFDLLSFSGGGSDGLTTYHCPC
jgi:hypothetical protein